MTANNLHKITTANPGCFVIAIDQSDSMKLPSGVGTKRRCDALADVVNDLILDLCIKSRKDGKIFDRFHVALVGYGEETRSLLPANGQFIVPITTLADLWFPGQRDGEEDVPTWVEPKHGGRTPMAAAFGMVRSELEGWVQVHRASCPPVVCNVTDGEWTDVDPSPEFARVMTLGTDLGKARLFHATFRGGPTLTFPSNADQLGDEIERKLFDHSSVIPDEMRWLAESRLSMKLDPAARGFIANGTVRQISDMLYIGSATSVGSTRG